MEGSSYHEPERLELEIEEIKAAEVDAELKAEANSRNVSTQHRRKRGEHKGSQVNEPCFCSPITD